MTLDPTKARAVVWAIGGVDSLAVAGVLADSRAANATGVHCAAIVSCVTAQNSHSFIDVNASDVSFLEAQWQALAQQTTAAVIKVGLIVTKSQARWLGDKISQYRQTHHKLQVIYDPVLISSSDKTLVDNDTLTAIKQFVLPEVDLLTPNIDEAQTLSGLTLQQPSDLIALARSLRTEYNLAVLLKGGHLNDKIGGQEFAYDCYLARLNDFEPREPATAFIMVSPFIDNQNLRGTGCTIASLIAAYVARDYTLCDALVLAKACINQAISDAGPLGNGRGGLVDLAPVTDFKYLPRLLSITEYLDQPLNLERENRAFAPCERRLGLYPVVSNTDLLERLLRLGVKTIQLRAKDFCDLDIEPQVIKAIALGRLYQARVFINDYWQLAVKHRAYGVHLGQEDLQLADLEQIKSAGLRLGLSSHGIYEALIAEQLAPSYIALGHIFATTTKEMPSTPQGLDKLAHQVKLFKKQRPLVAIGGIDRARVGVVARTGVGSIALVRAITEAEDITSATGQLLAEIGAGDQATKLTVTTGE